MSGDLLIASCFVGSFQDALLERGSGLDACDKVGRVHCPPTGLCGLDQPERHRDAGGAGAGSLEAPYAAAARTSSSTTEG